LKCFNELFYINTKEKLAFFQSKLIIYEYYQKIFRSKLSARNKNEQISLKTYCLQGGVISVDILFVEKIRN